MMVVLCLLKFSVFVKGDFVLFGFSVSLFY